MTLRDKMADFGFESNEDYDYQLGCLLATAGTQLRCLNIEGEGGRRKTAFANALAQALEYPHVLYFDFRLIPDSAVPETTAGGANNIEQAPTIQPFDRAVIDACAFSEASKSILIVDQFQCADFRDHIRCYEFIKSCEWETSGAKYFANRKNLLIFLISEDLLYHSLRKSSFNVWVNASGARALPYEPHELGLDSSASSALEALAKLFEMLGLLPTRSEYRRIFHDIHDRVRTAPQLAHSIYGWTEGIDRDLLFSDPVLKLIEDLMPTLRDYVGIDEVELSSSDLPQN